MPDVGYAHEAVDTESPDEVLMKKEDAMSIPFPLSGRVTMEMYFAIGDFAISNPERFQTIKTKSYYPEMTINQMANFLRIGRATVIRHLKPVNLKIKTPPKMKGLK